MSHGFGVDDGLGEAMAQSHTEDRVRKLEKRVESLEADLRRLSSGHVVSSVIRCVVPSLADATTPAWMR